MAQQGHTVRPGEGEALELGIVTMRILVAGDEMPSPFTLSKLAN